MVNYGMQKYTNSRQPLNGCAILLVLDSVSDHPNEPLEKSSGFFGSKNN